MIGHFLNWRTTATLWRRIDDAVDEGRTAEEIAVLALLRRGLGERARAAG